MFGGPNVSQWIIEDIFAPQQQSCLQPEFQQPLNRALFESNHSQEKFSRRESINDENSSPYKLKLAKSISMMGDDVLPSPLTPFVPNQLQKFNSEVFVNFELNRNQSNILGENKYIDLQAAMIVEQQEEQKDNTPVKYNLKKKKKKAVNQHSLDFGLSHLYEVIKFLGKGKLGKVFKVRSKMDGLYYAVKRISLHDLDALNQEILHSTIQQMVQNQFNSMVRIYDIQVESECVYIIQMEHCEFSLKVMQQQRQRLFESDIRRILLDISSNLLDLEQYPSHGNINPGNILYSKSQKYKLSDYGMSSVQCMATTWDIDRKYSDQLQHGLDEKKDDVYSLGVIALELMLEKELSKGIKFIGFNILNRLDNLFHYSISLKQLVKRMVSSFPEQRPSLKDIIKQTKVDTEEELEMLKRENADLQRQVDELVPRRQRNRSL